MADTYNLESARAFFEENNTNNLQDLSVKELVALNEGLYENNAYPDESLEVYRTFANEEMQKRLESLAKLDSYSPEELDDIVALADKYVGVGGSKLEGFANTVKERVTAQKNKIAEAQAAEQAGQEAEGSSEETGTQAEAAEQAGQEAEGTPKEAAAQTDTEDERVFTADDLDFEMDIVNSSIEVNAEKRFERNVSRGAKIISAFVNGSVELDAEALEKMSEYIDFYLGTDPKNEEAKKLRDEAVAKLSTLKAEVAKNKQNQPEPEENGQDGETAEEQNPDEVALEQAEAELAKNPETEEELAAFDKENGIDDMTEEQLEVNGQFMDGKADFNPFALNEEGKLQYPEFQEEYDAYNKMTVTDDNGSPLSEEEQKKAKETLLDTAQLEADITTRASAKGKDEDLEKIYRSNLKSSMQKAFVSTVFASEVQGKKLSAEQYAEAFTKAATNEGGAKAKKSSIIAYAGVVHGYVDKLKDRLKNKFKEIPAVKKISDKISAFDKKMGEKYPKIWKNAKKWGKIVAKGVGRVAVYGIISTYAGPIGMGVLAAKSGYDAYKNISKQAKAEGKSFREYAKEHKGQVALAFTTSGLAIAGSALGLGVGGAELAQAASPALKVATKALAVAPKAWDVLKHATKAAYYRVTGNKEAAKAEGKETLVAFERLAEVGVGLFIGHEVGEQIAEYQAEHAPQPEQTGSSIDPKTGAFKFIHGSEGDDMKLAVDPGKEWQPEQTEMMKPVEFDYERANETQLNRLLDANPKDVNALLNDGKWHSSAELHQMMENGDLSAEQVKSIHGLANTMFDKEGHITDEDLKDFYEQRAQDAKIEAQQAQVDVNKTTEFANLSEEEMKNFNFAEASERARNQELNDVGLLNPNLQEELANNGQQGLSDAEIDRLNTPAEIKYPEGTNLAVVNEDVTENGMKVVTLKDEDHGLTVVQYNDENGNTLETSVTEEMENGSATRTRYDSSNRVTCIEVQDENGVWVDAPEAQVEQAQAEQAAVEQTQVEQAPAEQTIDSPAPSREQQILNALNNELGGNRQAMGDEFTTEQTPQSASPIENNSSIMVEAEQAPEAPVTNSDPVYYTEPTQVVEAEQAPEAPVTNSDPVYYNGEEQAPVAEQQSGINISAEESENGSKFTATYQGDGSDLQEYKEGLRSGITISRNAETGQYEATNQDGDVIFKGSHTAVTQLTEAKLNSVSINEAAYQELAKLDPETLNDAQKDFMQKHNDVVSQFGAERGDDGQLVTPKSIAEAEARQELGLQDSDKVSIQERENSLGSSKTTNVTREDGSRMRINEQDIGGDGKVEKITIDEDNDGDGKFEKRTVETAAGKTVSEETDEGRVTTVYNKNDRVTEVGIDVDGDGRDDARGTFDKHGSLKSVSHFDDKGDVVQTDYLDKVGEVTQTKVADENGNMHVQKPGETNEQSEARKSMVDKIRGLQGLGKSNETTPVNKTTLNPHDITTGRVPRE